MKFVVVEEIMGPYGPVSVSESLLQKLWHVRRYRMERARLWDGRRLEVLDPGCWNMHEGPDFIGARLRIDGVDVAGDVEIHFHARDWNAHRHPGDGNYSQVVLHAVLFPPRDRIPPPGIAVLVLLPLLPDDIEACALEDALLDGTGQAPDPLLDRIVAMPVEERREQLVVAARSRWRQKVARAEAQLDLLGWDDALHGAVLEVQGYMRNRMPMRELAEAFPLRDMLSRPLSAQDYYAVCEGSFRLNGLRPASHPLRRIAQYLALLEINPAWTTDLRELDIFLDPRCSDADGTGVVRRRLRLMGLRGVLGQSILAGLAGNGARLDTLVCDAILPLVAVARGQDLFPVWNAWFVGNMPDRLLHVLSRSEVADAREWVVSNGLLQGVLQWHLEGGGRK